MKKPKEEEGVYGVFVLVFALLVVLSISIENRFRHTAGR